MLGCEVYEFKLAGVTPRVVFVQGDAGIGETRGEMALVSEDLSVASDAGFSA